MKLKFTDEELEVLGDEFVDLCVAKAIQPPITFQEYLEGEMWLKNLYHGMVLKKPIKRR